MKAKQSNNLSKMDKLLIVINEMSSGKKTSLRSEDIFVRAFKKYSDDFHLRGYPRYPDTGDATQRPLYSLRRNGLIQIHNKFVTLTEKGIDVARQLKKNKSGGPQKKSQKLTRDMMSEINRIKNTDVFQLFITGKKDQIVDTDFFTYLGATVKTERTDFRARIKTLEDIIKTVKKNEEYKSIVDLHNYLFDKYGEIIKAKLSFGFPRRSRS